MFSKLLVTGLLSLTTVSAFSMDAVKPASKAARSNDVASKYVLSASGKFSRIMKKSGLKCDITTNVSEFSVSGHKADLAMAYFKKEGNLHVLNNARGDMSQCPKTTQVMIVTAVKKYTVVSNTSDDSVIVNLTLDKAGNFKAWDNERAVLAVRNVKDYVNNTCFGKKGASFSSYTAFALKYDGSVVKVKGGEVERTTDSAYYTSLQDFKAANRVCE